MDEIEEVIGVKDNPYLIYSFYQGLMVGVHVNKQFLDILSWDVENFKFYVMHKGLPE